MGADQNRESSIFFNHSFDKKRVKALITWVFKQSGEAEALKVVDLLKETGFRHATKAGISIGLHDLSTPVQKSWLISESQLAMNTTEIDFAGARITASERSQRIIDTWHRASENLSKQVVDYFGVYDKFNPVYIMALSGARGNFSQVRQLIGMRGLMADQQGKIVNFPIRSNLREGLTLTEYFISCSGARKGLVDTALRTADTGYLTRRLVDVSHHVVVKRIRCNTARGIAFKSLQSYNKTLLPLKERLVGRVLSEDVFFQSKPERGFIYQTNTPQEREKKSQRFNNTHKILAKKDQEISLKLASKIAEVRDKVHLRSPLTCGFTHTVCQLCYGWSISQGSLVSLGDAVGVIAAQSIGEPGTQLTMRTFHTGGVFSGDLLQEIKAPHEGTIEFSKAFQGLLIRTAHGRIAFLSKTEGSVVVKRCELPYKAPQDEHTLPFKRQSSAYNSQIFKQEDFTGADVEQSSFATKTTIPIPAFTMLFVRQGEKVENNQLLAEFSIRTREGNQPIKTEQTIFAELSGKVVEDCTGKVYTKSIKESALFLDGVQNNASSIFPSQEVAPLPKKRVAYKSEICKPKSTRFAYKSEICKGMRKQRFITPKIRPLQISLPILVFGANKASLCKPWGKVQNGKYNCFAANKASLCKPYNKSSYKCGSIYGSKSRKQSRKKLCIPLKIFVANELRSTTAPVKCKALHTSTLGLCPTAYKSAYKSSCKSLICCGAKPQSTCKPKTTKFVRSFALAVGQSPKQQSKANTSDKIYSGEKKKSFFRRKRQGDVYIEIRNVVHKAFSMYRTQDKQINRRNNFLYSDSYKQGFEKREPRYLSSKSKLFLTKRPVFVSKQQYMPERLYQQANIKKLNLLQGVQNKALQNIFDTKLGRSIPSYNGKRFTFFNEMKKKQFPVCKTQILFSQKSEDFESDTFKYIEPVRAGRLGFLKILSTRVGATLDYISPLKSFNPSKKKKRGMQFKAFDRPASTSESLTKRNVFFALADKYLHPEEIKENRFFLQTIAEYGDIVEEGYSYNGHTPLNPFTKE